MDLRGLPVTMVLLVLKELLVLKGFQVLPDIKDLQVLI